MSQSELAQQLQITQSFLSAIENGKSPLPPEKENRLIELFHLDSLDGYIINPSRQPQASPRPDIDDLSEGDLFNRLLNRFHEQAHQKDSSEGHHHQEHHERIAALEESNSGLLRRIDYLLERNDRLAADNDTLRKEIDSLRDEIFRLKSLLMENGVSL